MTERSNALTRLISIILLSACAFAYQGLAVSAPSGLAARKDGGDDKISPMIHKMVSALQASSMPRGAMDASGPFTHSNPFVRVNKQGGIQVYIHVDSPDAQRQQELAEHDGVKIELSNETLGIVQGWISADKVAAVAQLQYA